MKQLYVTQVISPQLRLALVLLAVVAQAIVQASSLPSWVVAISAAVLTALAAIGIVPPTPKDHALGMTLPPDDHDHRAVVSEGQLPLL